MSMALSELTPAGVLARSEWLISDRRAIAAEEYGLALAWADLHSAEPDVVVPGGEKMIRIGGAGTPLVRDLCLAELAVARGEHVHATRALVADVLDLRHRLPGLWAAVQILRVEPWVARRIASMSRKLGVVSVTHVDVALGEGYDLPAGKLLTLAEARVIEADQTLRAEEIEEAKARKGVWVTGTRPGDDQPAGLRGIYARLEAADVIWVDATCQRVADLLAVDPGLRAAHHPELGADPSTDELRAAAFGWLARPYDLAALLGMLDEDQAVAGEKQAARRHKATVFVHLHQAALEGAGGVARSSDLGPLLLDQVTQLLGHSNVVVKPVIDLNTGHAIDGYEHPTAVRERTMLRTNGPVFPHSSGSQSSRVDHDHPTPYVPPDPSGEGGPPGQTGDHNDAPLPRHAHRAKTHLPYRVEQLGHGAYLWTTPHGLIRLLTPTGTHRITEDDLDLIHRLYGI